MDALNGDASPPSGQVVVKLYAKEVGTSGKYQLLARFPTGAIQVVASEP